MITSRFLYFGFLACLLSLSTKDSALAGESRGVIDSSQVGRRDLILLLPNSPMHIRLKITDGSRSLEQIRGDYLDKLIATLDVDSDGQLSQIETQNHAMFMTGKRFSDTELVRSLRPLNGMNRLAIEKSVERAIGQSMVFRQIGSVADQDLQVFKILDEDQSGLIERSEMRTAAARLAARDIDHDYCVTFDEFLTNEVTSTAQAMNMMGTVAETLPPVHSELLRDAREPVMASRLIRNYDIDRDASLSQKELNWDSDRVAALDQNSDGVLSVAELTKIADSEPDIYLAIDLSLPDELQANKPPDTEQPFDLSKYIKLSTSNPISTIKDESIIKDKIRLITSRQSASAKLLSGGLIEIRQPTITITINYRSHDPVDQALLVARDNFNAIDTDGNGYIDREEITTHPRFQRYLFDAMDANHDDRVFSKEMLEYVRGIAEPSATVCQITLFDSGNGFFQMLDRNGDGRVSIRELRASEENLLSHAQNNSLAINPSQMPRYFKIEIQRGGPTPFNSMNRPKTETPQPILQGYSGPIWFQRMDRNGDSDLVWDEFLGPREVFDRLDIDEDRLLDSAEASAAGN